MIWWVYKYIPALWSQYTGLSMTLYPKALAWSLCIISKVILSQLATIGAALDYVTWGEIYDNPYDGGLLIRHEVILAIVQLHARHWFWALMSWEFFLAERTFHQFMLIFRVPRDPHLEISCPEMILDDLAHATGSFECFLTIATNYTN